MVQRKGGARRKTRTLLRKSKRQKGKVSIRKALQQFENGDKVLLQAEPAIQHGMYFRRFHGSVGTVVGEQGKCYLVRVKDGNKSKDLIIHPVHLTQVQ